MQLSSLTGVHKTANQYESDASLPRPLDLIGIEVELESMGEYHVPLWTAVRDGSLRDGIEYVFTSPLYGTGIKAALDNLQGLMNQYQPNVSERCSVHVHINVSDMDVQEFQKLLVIYTIFERVLFKYHTGREDNVFCVPWYKSDIKVGELLALQDAVNLYDWDCIHTEKYSALNILPISNFGSIEFRHMGGCTDTEQMLAWVRIIMRMKDYAHQDISLQQMPGHLSGTGGRRFLREVFKEEARLLEYIDIEDDLIKGIRTAQRAIFASRFSRETASTRAPRVPRATAQVPVPPMIDLDVFSTGTGSNTRLTTDWLSSYDILNTSDHVQAAPAPLRPREETDAERSVRIRNYINGIGA